MEWIKEPNIPEQDTYEPQCAAVFVGGAIAACYASGALCGSLCAIYLG